MAKFKLLPLQGQCVVVRAESENMVGSIFLPDTVKERPHWGKVVAVGVAKSDYVLNFKAGDTVLFGKWSGAEVEFPGDPTKYMVLHQEDVWCRLVEIGKED